MIATIIRGGLGNQMFMYAMTRAMALRNKTSAVYNLKDGFERDFAYRRKLELLNFNVHLERKPRVTFDYPFSRYSLYVSKRMGFNVFSPNYRYVKEKTPFRFEPELKECKESNLFLDGYWQSEKYFDDYCDVIRDDFKITMPIAEEVKTELCQWNLGEGNLVFIGVRRYQECKTLSDGVLLDEDYYNNAIKIMESKVSSPRFIVFSQQQEWAKTHLKAKSPIYYASPKEGDNSSVNDLFLMKQCHHAIISNSSFYWWGAWLSKAHEEGIVIAPNNFLNKNSVCDKWLKL